MPSYTFAATGECADMLRSTKTIFGALTIMFGLMSQAVAATERFTTDEPSPLKLAKRHDGEPQVVRFTGHVVVSGRFVVAWDVLSNTPRYLRVMLLPNEESARRLPHPTGSEAVRELLLSNNEQAARLLLGPQAAAKLFAKEVLSAKGEATVVITDYRSVVVCDNDRYLARLVSASDSRDVAFAATPSKRGDC
jgi:hypothetical protein